MTAYAITVLAIATISVIIILSAIGSKGKMTTSVATPFIVVVFLAAGGWAANLVKLIITALSGQPIDLILTELILRAFGAVFPPLGVIAGYF